MEDSTEIGVLKPLWTRLPDGRWGIHGLKGIQLKPKAGHDADFFAFDSKMEMLTTTPPTNQGDMFASFGPTDFLMKQSIVPVVAWVPGARSMRCIGTGFIVSCTGYVVTASHVVLDPRDSGYGKVVGRSGNVEALDGVALGVLMPVSPARAPNTFEFRPFVESCYWGKWQQSPLFHVPDTLASDTDVAVCKIQERRDGSAYQPLNLSLNPFTVGETACAIGYALMEDIPVSYVDGRPCLGAFEWELYVSVGEVTEVYPLNHAENKQVKTPGPCFAFRARIPGKMSGSPIFGAKGAVIRGVVSSSYSGEKDATGCMIGPVTTLAFPNGQSLGSLLQGGKDGMAVVNGQGL
jgi:hypothetical protein